MAAGELDEIYERLGGAEAAIRLLVGALHRISPPHHARMLREMDDILRRSADILRLAPRRCMRRSCCKADEASDLALEGRHATLKPSVLSRGA